MPASIVIKLCRVSTWCCVFLLAVLSLLPAQDMVRTGMPGRVEHFIAYGGSAMVAMAGYQQTQGAFRTIGLLCIYAATLELLQHLSPGRHPSIGDFAASALGALAGGLGILLVSRLSLSSKSSEAG
jgi:VanZ family protein